MFRIDFAYTESFVLLDDRMNEMETKARKKLHAQGLADSQIQIEPFLNLRYEGTDCALMCSPECEDITKMKAGNATKHGDFLASFLKRYAFHCGNIFLIIYLSNFLLNKV